MNGYANGKTAWDNRRRIQFNFTTIAGRVFAKCKGGEAQEEALPVLPNEENYQVNSTEHRFGGGWHLARMGNGDGTWRGTMPAHTQNK